jgi:hypothetical protein
VIRGAALFLGLLATACAPAADDAQVAYLAPDCARPFAEQVTALTAQPRLQAAGIVGSEPYAYWSSVDGRVSYLITRESSPAHPAIMMQTATGGVKTTGCAWGDRKGYDELHAYLDSLKTWTRTK